MSVLTTSLLRLQLRLLLLLPLQKVGRQVWWRSGS
jgi:hypothetical protein